VQYESGGAKRCKGAWRNALRRRSLFRLRGRLGEMRRIGCVGKLGPMAAIVLAACADSSTVELGPVRSEVTQAGDTTIVTSYGEPTRVRSGQIEVIWQSLELEDPEALLYLDDRLIVADRRRLHVLRDRGRSVRSVGREGEGPGEFGFIFSIGRLGGDTVAVLDERNQRLAFFTSEGDYLGAARTTPPAPYINPLNSKQRGGPARGLVPLDGGVLSLWRDGVFADGKRQTRTALVWSDPAAGTTTVLRTWDGAWWLRESGFVTPVQLFGPRVISALARDGRVAIGYGTDYCIVIRAAAEAEVKKVCRSRAPAAVGDGIRRPDLSRVEDPRRRQALEVLVQRQDVGQHLPHFDRMMFDEEGRLWVRTIGAEFSDVSPYLRRDAPELQPEDRDWDVFDRDGHLLATVEIPSNFEPQAATFEEIFGFVELPSGEIAIGASAISF